VGRPGGALARSARAEFQLQLLNTTVHQLVGSNYQHVVHTLHNYSLLIHGLDSYSESFSCINLTIIIPAQPCAAVR